MTNPEQINSNPSANALAGEKQIQNEADAFCRIMERLNAVSLRQMEGLFNIAVSAAKELYSINPADDQAGSAGVPEFIDQIEKSAEGISAKAKAELEKVTVSEGGSFDQAFEHALANAVQNSVACQQQLNVLGTAILAQAAALLLKQDRKAQ